MVDIGAGENYSFVGSISGSNEVGFQMFEVSNTVIILSEFAGKIVEVVCIGRFA